jgi:hypothetical protein
MKTPCQEGGAGLFLLATDTTEGKFGHHRCDTCNSKRDDAYEMSWRRSFGKGLLWTATAKIDALTIVATD